MAKETNKAEQPVELTNTSKVSLSEGAILSIGENASFKGDINCQCGHAEDPLESTYRKKLLKTKIAILDKIQEGIEDNGNIQHTNMLAATFKSLS